MKVVFLGTNGWYDTPTGNTICTFLETEHYYILLDAGNGIYKLNKYLKDSKKTIYLFLSHFHLDHIEGLHILNKFNFKNKLKIYGQRGAREVLDKIINQPFTVPFKDLPFDVDVYEIDEGIHELPFEVECRFLLHASPCLGYRLKLDGKVVTYCTDTGTHENVENLAKDADLLITECSLRMEDKNPGWPHLNPEEAVKIALKAKAKNLALTHFDAHNYPSMNDRIESKASMLKLFKNILYTTDEMKIDL